MSSSSSNGYLSCVSQLSGDSDNEDKKTGNIPIKLLKDNFEVLHLVGKGGYGKVFQVRKKNGRNINQIYAMKVVQTSKMTETRLHIERDILMSIQHPFIVELYYIFQSNACIFYILEYLCGGELRSLIRKQKVFSELAASFYIKEIVLALEYLHSLGIIYRDLKPGNILLDFQGHVKIIDFGLSKIIEKSDIISYKVCGSPAYMAPEMVLGRGYGTAIDWWSMGVLFYVMVVGKKPFQVAKNKLFNTDYSDYLIPEHVTLEAAHLIIGLLEINPTKRLGSSGANRIKLHPFFNGTYWDGVLNRQETPPFSPRIENESDISQFNCNLTNLRPNNNWIKNFFCRDSSPLIGFNYIRFPLLEEDTTDLFNGNISDFNL